MTPNSAKYSGNEFLYLRQALGLGDSEARSTDWIQRFEDAFAEKVGCRYAIAVNSGTSGLHASLFGVGVQEGDEVIQPGLTVVMDAYATLALGADPVFADVCLDTHHIDPAEIERLITPRSKAILTVSWEGSPVRMEAIRRLAATHGLRIVDDSAQTMMGRCYGKVAGTNADVGIFSFENKKHLTTGSEGGMVVTDSEDVAVRVRKFAGIGYKHMTAKTGRTSLALAAVQNPGYERFDTVGMNYRMNVASAAIGLGQLERVDEIVERRRVCASLFAEAIDGAEWLVPQQVPEGCKHSYYTYSIEYHGWEKRGVTWKDFYRRYVEAGGDGFYACVMNPYLEPSLRGRYVAGHRWAKGLCPNAEHLQSHIMSFKTNYRDMRIAGIKARVLAELVDEIGR